MRRESAIGNPFVQLVSVSSTNNYAMAQVHAGLAGHGACWFAHQQTEGKGQRGKAWLAEAGQNILMSIVLEPRHLFAYRQFELNSAIALAGYDLFSNYAGDHTKIKWPNDIYYKDRKAGGILIENVIQGNVWKYAVAGVGININQTDFSPELPNPISLKQICSKTFDPVALAQELCGFLEKRWHQTKENPTEILENYLAGLYKLGETATLKTGNLIFKAVIKGVNSKGELVVDKGQETAVSFSEIEWLIS